MVKYFFRIGNSPNKVPSEILRISNSCRSCLGLIILLGIGCQMYYSRWNVGSQRKVDTSANCLNGSNG